MPTKIYLPEDANHSGIDITWTKTSQTLDIGGWYDSCVGIQTSRMTLANFFKALGITRKDVEKSLSKPHRRTKMEPGEFTDLENIAKRWRRSCGRPGAACCQSEEIRSREDKVRRECAQELEMFITNHMDKFNENQQ